MREKCPKFDRCNIPICPLDKDKDLRVELSEDIKCPYAKDMYSMQKKKRNKREE
jgi:hypothetical protein